jgi:hypothetical protein
MIRRIQMNKFYLEAEIQLEKETTARQKAFAAVIELPRNEDKQPDLQYFSAIFVSAGTNLNGAHFLPSELVKAEDTIVSKALDVEHKEEDIIGHIYDRAFIDDNNQKLDLVELANKEDASLDSENNDMHVVIAGVIYKNRFPNLAKEVSEGDWKVSMECYFSNYDVKIGDLVLTRREAESMGLAHDDRLFGKMAKVVKKGKEIAKGTLERVLRDIVFSGCGIVKNPANPPSVILETASDKGLKTDPKDVIVLDYDLLEDSNKLTSNKVEGDTSVITDPSETEDAMQYNDTRGICVNYKRRVFAEEPQGPDTEVVNTDWCTLYDRGCTSFGRDTSDPDCLRNQLGSAVKQYAKKLLTKREQSDRRAELTNRLKETLEKAEKAI